MKKEIFLFDLETTGTDPATDRIIQLAYILLDEQLKPLINPVSMLINPGISIPRAATEIHRITDDMVSEKLNFKSFSKFLFDIIKDRHVAGYNSNGFDVPLLANEFIRAGCEVPFDNETLFLDVFQMYRKLNSMKLSDVYYRIFKKELVNAHDATTDILATQKVLQHIVEENKNQVGCSPNEWSDFIGGMEDPFWFELINGEYYFVKGKYKGARVSDHLSYCEWMMSQSMTLNTKSVICRIFGADLWQSISESRLVYKSKSIQYDGLPF